MQHSGGVLLAPGWTGVKQLFSFPAGMKMQIKSLHLRQIRTQDRIQLFVPILRFLLLFRGIFALSRHKKHIFDRRSPSSESFCAFGGWAFLLALNLWVIVIIMVIVKIIVYGRYLVLNLCLFYAII